MDEVRFLALPCIVCDKLLTNVFPDRLKEDESQQQPKDGVVFISYGNYGSAVFDSFGIGYIELNICDSCLLAKGGNVRWIRKVPQPDQIVEFMSFANYYDPQQERDNV